MADIFGDDDLFTEFDKQRPPSDKILKQKLDGEFRTHRISNGSLFSDTRDSQTAAYERRFYADDDVHDCGVENSADCGENSNVVLSSKLAHLQNEVHRLRMLNIFLDTAGVCTSSSAVDSCFVI